MVLSLKNEFKIFLVKKGWNMKKAAEKLGISYNYLWKLLNGKKPFNSEIAIKFRSIGFKYTILY